MDNITERTTSDVSKRRFSTISKWAYDESCKNGYSIEVAAERIIAHFKKVSGWMTPQQIDTIRRIENGGIIYEHDSASRGIHAFTAEDDSGKLVLRESGFVLLFSIDSN